MSCERSDVKTWLCSTALLILVLSTGCVGTGGAPPVNTGQQASGPASDEKTAAEPSPVPTLVPTPVPTAVPSPTAVRTPAWIEIARGTIEILRGFNSATPGGGTDTQTNEGKIPFVVTQREDWYTTGQARGGEVHGQGTIKWTEQTRSSNCSWDAEATETATITGELYTKPQCRLSLKVTETGAPIKFTMQQCVGPLSSVLTHEPFTYQLELFWKKDDSRRGIDLAGDVWNHKMWWLRDPQADFYTGCSATP